MSSFAKSLIDTIKDEDTHLAYDGNSAAEYSGCIDSGCYILNAVMSGSIYGGFADNKVTAIAGESSVGKSFFVLQGVKSFQEKYPDGVVFYYDTEAAVTKKMMEDRGIDTKRLVIVEPNTIEKFRTHVLKLVNTYTETKDKNKPRLMIVLDSLSMMSSEKELHDTQEGSATRDMTKAPLIKALFRTLTLKIAKANIPILITAHVYDMIGAYVPTKVISGGSGLKFSASSIIMLSKKKDKDGTEVVGNIIKAAMAKSRLSKENAFVEVKLSYTKGLDRYYGLLALAEKYSIIERVGTRYVLPNGDKVFGKYINENPEKVYTEDLLKLIDEAAKKEFMYGAKDDIIPSEDEIGESDSEESSDE